MKKKQDKVRNYKGKRHLFQSITTVISATMVLILVGMTILTGFTANNLSKYIKQNLTITLLLAHDINTSESVGLCNKLKQKKYISQLTYISKEQALEEGKKALGADPSEFMGMNPFPASIEFKLKADYANNDSLKIISQELSQNSKITDITYPKDLIEDINKTLTKIGAILIVLASLLVIISFALINNTVRLSVHSRRFSIHTMKLVGASWAFIRKPFILKALRQGLFAGIFANIVLALGIYAIYLSEQDIFDVVDNITFIITGSLVLLIGITLTTICAWISVNKFLRVKAGDLYKI